MARMRSALAAALLVSLPASAAQHIAVLELKNRLRPALRDQFPAEYFTDQIRQGALRVVDAEKLQIISRENLLVLLRASGKTLDECEGECEVDTGKRIGADYVVSGELVMVGSTAKASLKLHDTQAGNLLSAVTATGRTAEDLDQSLAASIPTLLAPLRSVREEPRAGAPAKPETKAGAKPPPRWSVEKASGPSTLADLPSLPRVIKLVKENYFDPPRVEAQKMLDGAVAALAASSNGAIEVDATSVRAGGRSVARPRSADLDGAAEAMRGIGEFLNGALPADHPLLQGAAGEYVVDQGVLQALDSHSTLLTPSVAAEMRVTTRGTFGGLGIVTQVRDGKLRVLRVLPSTPAARADLRVDDLIASIDGKPTDAIELADAVNLLRGEVGSRVQLVVDRGGKRLPVEIVRAVINLAAVRSAMLPGGIAYLRLESYTGGASEKIKAEVASLSPAPVGIVFDLRGNGGGLLQQAVEISDYFLPGGAIVTTTGNGGKLHSEQAAKPGDAGEAVPIVVLVDGGTGAAAEITAGALRFNGRAILVGGKTAGRGTVQATYDLPGGAIVKITIAQYLIAGVHAVEGKGLDPDVSREGKFDEDPAKDAVVSFARQVLLDAKTGDRDALLAAARAR